MFRKYSSGLMLAGTVMLAGCAGFLGQGHTNTVVAQARKAFGDPSKIAKELARDRIGIPGATYAFRVYSEKPMPDAYQLAASNDYASATVLDVVVQFREVEGFPIYRIGLKPQKLPDRVVQNWPQFVALDVGDAAGDPLRLVARLPATRSADQHGIVWSQQSYCPGCFNLAGLEDAARSDSRSAFNRINLALAAANGEAEATRRFRGGISFSEDPGFGVLVDRDAVAMAPRAAAVLKHDRDLLAQAEAARADYLDLRERYAGRETPASRLSETCGLYRPGLGIDSTDPAEEHSRLEAYVACYKAGVSKLDTASLQSQIAQMRAHEAALASKARMDPAKRFKVLSVEEELAAVQKIEDRMVSAYLGWRARQISGFTADPKPSASLRVEPRKAVEQKSSPVHSDAGSGPAPLALDHVEGADSPVCATSVLCGAFKTRTSAK